MTVKSDDVKGRVETYEAIVKGENIPEPGMPESFRVLMKELQSLCLDVSALDQDGKIIDIKESVDEEIPEDFKIESIVPEDIEETHVIEEVEEDSYDYEEEEFSADAEDEEDFMEDDDFQEDFEDEEF